jgi:hypothetical protein
MRRFPGYVIVTFLLVALEKLGLNPKEVSAIQMAGTVAQIPALSCLDYSVQVALFYLQQY